MQLIFLIIIVIAIGLVFSKIKINIEKIELNFNNIVFQIKIGIFLFRFYKNFWD